MAYHKILDQLLEDELFIDPSDKMVNCPTNESFDSTNESFDSTNESFDSTNESFDSTNESFDSTNKSIDYVGDELLDCSTNELLDLMTIKTEKPIHRYDGKIDNEKEIYIGIGSGWYEQYKIINSKSRGSLDGFLKYGYYLLNRYMTNPSVLLDTFYSKTLVCSCMPHKLPPLYHSVCHGDVLIEHIKILERIKREIDKIPSFDQLDKNKKEKTVLSLILCSKPVIIRGDRFANIVIEKLIATGGTGTVLQCRLVENAKLLAKHLANQLVIKISNDAGNHEINLEIEKMYLLEQVIQSHSIFDCKFPQIIENLSIPSTILDSGPTYSALVMKRYGKDLFEILSDWSWKNMRNKKNNQLEIPHPFSMKWIQSIAKQLIDTIFVLHNKLMLIHCDIKLENICTYEQHDNFESCPDIVLIDYGLSSKKGECGEIKGTVQMMSPEELTKNEWSEETDCWSLGLVLFELAVGRSIFETNEISKNQVDMNCLIIELINGERIDEVYLNNSNEFIKNLDFLRETYSYMNLFDSHKNIYNTTYIDRVVGILPNGDLLADMIKGLLRIDKLKRSTAEQLKSHPFIVTQLIG
jgi:serine/threonine protein kinase